MDPVTRTGIAFFFSACLGVGALLSRTEDTQRLLFFAAVALCALAVGVNLRELRAEGRAIGWTQGRRLPVAGLNLSAVLLTMILATAAVSLLD